MNLATNLAHGANTHPDRVAVRLGEQKTPIEGVDMPVLDVDGRELAQSAVGEIAIRGHNVTKGHWRRPEATATAIPDDWFRTGDLGRFDEESYFLIVDRKKDMIIRGGYNVYPREIEEILYEHPDVAEAAVIGLPDPLLGEEVAAAVALKPGASTTADDLRAHVRAQVGAYNYPRYVWLVDALPKGPTGKILKREIVAPTEPSPR
jgi:long-chain acyl-CoA synthetase